MHSLISAFNFIDIGSRFAICVCRKVWNFIFIITNRSKLYSPELFKIFSI
nr:MAG TPA_asm: hypothetical protein [Bacteriophage sp.]